MNFRELTAFSYQIETFTKARRRLMLPYPNGEAVAIMHAFHECHLGLPHLKEEDLDYSTRERIRTYAWPSYIWKKYETNYELSRIYDR